MNEEPEYALDDDDLAFYREVDKVADAVNDLVCSLVDESPEGYAIALEAIQEIYQSLLLVPAFSSLEDLDSSTES